MKSLGKGPEMICSYGEGSCKRAFVMREGRSCWSTKGAKGRLDLHAPAAQGAPESHTGGVRIRCRGADGEGGGARQGHAIPQQRAELLHGRGEAGNIMMSCLCFRNSAWFTHDKVREGIWDVFENERFWMQWNVYQIWQRVKFCALFLGNIYIHRCKNGS